jgi:hypothetical protein
MTASQRIRPALEYTTLVVVTFVVMQTLVVVMHEFTHSTVAWLLGHMRSPLDIVWGNPLTLRCWDEGVSYIELIESGHLIAEAVIGVSPLVLHTAIVTMGLILMRKGIPRNKWVSHFLFWFIIANFMELIAYIVMRSFAQHGDTGHFNHGLGLSPWFLFIVGSLAIVLGLYVLFGEIIPRMYNVFARGNRLLEWIILIMTAFFLFLWGSGIRVVSAVYPDSQWMFGLLGFAAFGLVMIACNPGRAWMVRRKEMK